MGFERAKRSLIGLLRRLQRNHSNNSRASYSQCGEDLVLQQLLSVLRLQDFRYLDIGAHHPSYLSNTYFFYLQGASGVCVEPDPSLFEEFPKLRPRDTHLNCGVGVEPGFANFFVMSTPTLNTFSSEEASRYVSSGNYFIRSQKKIEILTINHIIENNFLACPNLVSLDIEGWDLIVLKSLDFQRYRPEVFCIETLSFTEDNSERKLTEVIEFMHQNDYITYGDTYINTIFVDRACWEKRPL
jgi:FkbM family methyltransferase